MERGEGERGRGEGERGREERHTLKLKVRNDV